MKKNKRFTAFEVYQNKSRKKAWFSGLRLLFVFFLSGFLSVVSMILTYKVFPFIPDTDFTNWILGMVFMLSYVAILARITNLR